MLGLGGNMAFSCRTNTPVLAVLNYGCERRPLGAKQMNMFGRPALPWQTMNIAFLVTASFYKPTNNLAMVSAFMY